MRDWHGISYAAVQDAQTRDALATVDDFLKQLSPAIARLGRGEVPDSSTDVIVPPIILTDYLYLPGRAGGQLIQSVSTTDTMLTMKAVASQTGDFLRWTDSAGTVKARVLYYGAVETTQLIVTAAGAVQRLIIDDGSPYAQIRANQLHFYAISGAASSLTRFVTLDFEVYGATYDFQCSNTSFVISRNTGASPLLTVTDGGTKMWGNNVSTGNLFGITHTVPSAIAANYTLTWPAATADGYLKNTAGTLSFDAAPGSGSFAPVGEAFVTIGNTANLSGERALAATAPITLTDGGAGAAATLALADTAVTPDSYGSATQVGAFTVDAQGRLTAAASITITGTAPGVHSHLDAAGGGKLSGAVVATPGIDYAGFMAIAMACDNGAAFPTSPAPTEGQWFLFEPGSRRVLYQYISGAWKAIIGFAASSVYVATTGNDTTGTGESGAPYATWQKAFDNVPRVIFDGAWTINFAAGTYTESPTLSTKLLGASGMILQGPTLDAESTETITGHDGGTTGTAADPGPQVQATITRSAGTWTANQYRGYIISIVGATAPALNLVRVVEGNSTTALTLCGNPLARAVVAADVITIKPVSTAANGAKLVGNLTISIPNNTIDLRDLHIAPTGGTNCIVATGSSIIFRRFRVIGRLGVALGAFTQATILDSFIEPTTSGTRGVNVNTINAAVTVSASYIRNNGSGASRGVNLTRGSELFIDQGSVIDGFATGIFSQVQSRVIFNASSTTLGTLLKNNTVPIDASAEGFWQTTLNVANFLTITSGTNADIRWNEPFEFSKTIRSVAQVAPVTPLSGHVWNDSTQFTLYEYTNAIRQSLDGAIFTQTANVTVDSAVVTTTETSLVGAGNGTNTLPASWWRSGKSLRVSAAGVISTQAVPGTLRIKIKKGATILLDTLAQAPTGAMVNHLWRIDATITGRSTTTVTGQSYFEYTPAVIGAPQFWEMTNSVAGVAAPLTLATIGTGAEAITITAQWSAASLTDTITLTNLLLESLN